MKQDSASNHKMLCLEASCEGSLLKVGIRKADAAIWTYEAVPIFVEKIEARCRDMVDALNKASRKSGNGDHSVKTVETVGRMLADILLPPQIKAKLANTDAEYLLLSLDDEVVHIPWELLNIGEGFLCERFSTGRMVGTRQKFVESPERKLSDPLKMWIVANPGNDLKSAAVEGRNLCDIMDRMNEHDFIVDASEDSEVTSDDIRERLKSFDMVHFAGHADFDSENPAKSGWRLKNSNFRASDAFHMMGGAPMPALVFSNACQSARTRAWIGKDIENSPLGLANAFMLAGVKHYIGTSWDVTDEPSSRFAQNFYISLLSGMTIGESVRQARKTMIEEGDNICWASYVLYGNPKERYFGRSDTEMSEKPEPLISLIPTENSNTARSSEHSETINEPPAIPFPKPSGISLKSLAAIIIAALVTAIIFIITVRIMSKKESKDDWTSSLLSIAVIVEIQTADTDKISAAAESSLKNYRRIKLVNRMEIEIIKRELDLWMSPYMDTAHKPKPGLLPAMLILHLKMVREDDSRHSVLMRLLNTQDGTIKEIFTEKLATPVSVSEQKAWADEHIVRKLRELYPLRGIITEVGKEGIRLDIGDNVGVDLKQQFKVLGKDTILEVISVKADSCIAKTISGSSIVSKNSKVEAF